MAKISTECPRNFYKEEDGSRPCTPCPDYSESSPGSQSIDDCNCTYGTKPNDLVQSSCQLPPEPIQGEEEEGMWRNGKQNQRSIKLNI